jgi:hypothetical protein
MTGQSRLHRGARTFFEAEKRRRTKTHSPLSVKQIEQAQPAKQEEGEQANAAAEFRER